MQGDLRPGGALGMGALEEVSAEVVEATMIRLLLMTGVRHVSQWGLMVPVHVLPGTQDSGQEHSVVQQLDIWLAIVLIDRQLSGQVQADGVSGRVEAVVRGAMEKAVQGDLLHRLDMKALASALRPAGSLQRVGIFYTIASSPQD